MLLASTLKDIGLSCEAVVVADKYSMETLGVEIPFATHGSGEIQKVLLSTSNCSWYVLLYLIYWRVMVAHFDLCDCSKSMAPNNHTTTSTTHKGYLYMITTGQIHSR